MSEMFFHVFFNFNAYFTWSSVAG